MGNQVNNDEITLKELVTTSKSWYTYLLHRWKIIIIFSLLGGMCGLCLAFVSKPVYTASLTFIVEDQPSGEMNGALGMANMLGFDIGNSGSGIFTGANLIELFKSRNMVQKALLSPVPANGQLISFAEMYIRFFKLREIWAKNTTLQSIQFLPNADATQFSRSQDSIMGTIYQAIKENSLKVEQRDKRIDIISIDMQSASEEFAKYFTEALVKEVSEFYISTKSKKARMNMDILESQMDSVRAELNSSISGVARATDNTFSLNPAINIARVPFTRRQVDVQANTDILMELVKQTETAKVLVRKSTPLVQIIDRPVFPLKKEKMGKLRTAVIGGFLAGILILAFLILQRLYKKLNEL